MKALSLARVALFAAGVGILASCTPDGGTIYATIETETKTVDNSLPNTLTVGGIVKTGANTYYVAAGHLYKGVLDIAKDKVAWTSVHTLPTEALATTLAYDGTNLWGGFITPGSALGLYKSSPPFTADFGAEADLSVAAKQVYGLSTVNATELFVVTAVPSGSGYAYELVHHAGAWAGAPLLTGVTNPMVGVAFGGAPDLNYFTASGGTISWDAGGTGSFTTGSHPLSNGDRAQGIFADTTNQRVFVVTKSGTTVKSGGVYYTTNDGGGWTHVLAPVLNSAPVPLLSIAGPIDAGNDIYLVGSDGFGYFTFTKSTGKFGRFSGSTIGLYSASIGRIFLDGTTVLMGTNGAGLWRAKLDLANGDLVASSGDVASDDPDRAAVTASAWAQE